MSDVPRELEMSEDASIAAFTPWLYGDRILRGAFLVKTFKKSKIVFSCPACPSHNPYSSSLLETLL